MLIRSGEIPSPRQTSIDKTNDCAMETDRGALVRGSDPPSGHSVHKMTVIRGGRRPGGQASETNTFGALLCRKQATKFVDPSPMANSRPLFRFGIRA